MTISDQRRSGLTIVELLVVIAIVALLIALLFPAAQGAREAARRVQCGNNLKQMGLAAHMHERSQGCLPPSRIAEHSATWAVLILPYLEQQPLYNEWDLGLRYYDPAHATARTTPVAGYFCPSRSTPVVSASGDVPDSGGTHTPGARGDYAACGGDYSWPSRGWPDGYGSDITEGRSLPCRANGAIVTSTYPYVWPPPARLAPFNWSGRVTFAHVPDGLSNTVCFGEQYAKPGGTGIGYGSIYNGDHEQHFSAVAGPGWPLAPSETATGFSAGPTLCFGGPHPGVCLFVMLDGSVVALNVGIESTTLGNLASRNDRQVTTLSGP